MIFMCVYGNNNSSSQKEQSARQRFFPPAAVADAPAWEPLAACASLAVVSVLDFVASPVVAPVAVGPAFAVSPFVADASAWW